MSNEPNEQPPIQADYSQPPSPQSAFAQPPTDSVSKLIPTSNPNALLAYYFAVFGLIPGFCLILAPVAVILGVLGLKKIKENPGLPGKTHAMIGIILGGIVSVLTVGLILYVVIFAKRS